MANSRFIAARRHKFVDRRTGSIAALTSTIWANLDTTADITIEAQLNDILIVQAQGYWGTEAQTAFMDVQTFAGGVGVNWFGSGEPTTITGSGVPSWADAQGVAGSFKSIAGSMRYTVKNADIVNGQVQLRLRYRVSGSKTFNNSATIPFQWVAENIGPQQGH